MRFYGERFCVEPGTGDNSCLMNREKGADRQSKQKKFCRIQGVCIGPFLIGSISNFPGYRGEWVS